MIIGCKSNKPNNPPTPDDPDIPNPPPEVSNFIQTSGLSLTLNEKPWKFVADTAWLITENIGNDRAQVCKYLDGRKAQGFNTIIIGCNGKWFTKSVTVPNTENFARLDNIFEDATARNMFIILSPQITQYDEKGTPVILLPIEQSEAIGAYYGKRYATQDHLAFWMVGGLDDKILASTAIEAFAKGIRSTDSKHLITYHPRAGRTTTEVFPISNTHQIALYQSYHTYDWTTHNVTLTRLQQTGAPFANIEGPFDEEPGVTSDNVIQVAQYAAKFPVCGFAYGNTYIWPFSLVWRYHTNSTGVQGFLKAVTP